MSLLGKKIDSHFFIYTFSKKNNNFFGVRHFETCHIRNTRSFCYKVNGVNLISETFAKATSNSLALVSSSLQVDFIWLLLCNIGKLHNKHVIACMTSNSISNILVWTKKIILATSERHRLFVLSTILLQDPGSERSYEWRNTLEKIL